MIHVSQKEGLRITWWAWAGGEGGGVLQDWKNLARNQNITREEAGLYGTSSLSMRRPLGYQGNELP